MARHQPLADAVAELVHDGDTVALEGFTHLIPFAAGHEIIRQGRRDLTLVRMTPDVVYDQLIGAGCARKLIFSLGRQPRRRLAAPLPRRGPDRLAGAAGDRGAQPRRDGQPLRRRRLRAAVRGAARLPRHRPADAHRHDPQPIDVPVHRRDADRGAGARPRRQRSSTRSRPTAPATCSSGASPACRRRPCWPPAARSSPSRRSSTSSSPPYGAVVLPGWAVTAVAEVPGGAAPSYAAGLLRPRQRRLPRVGRDQPRPRHLRAVAARDRARHGGDRMSAEPTWTADEMMTVEAARALHGVQSCFVGIGLPSTAANLARAHARPRPRAGLRVRRHRRQARLAAAVDRRRRAGRDRRRGGLRPRDLQLLAAARPDRRRLPRRRPDRPRAQHQHHGDRRPYDDPEGAAARRRRRARDRRLVRRGDRRSCGTAPRVFVDRVDFVTSVGFGDAPRRPAAARSARQGAPAGHHRPGRAAAGPRAASSC